MAYSEHYIWYRMDVIDRKIGNCEAAISSIEQAKSSCCSTRDSLQSDFSKLTSDSDLSEIRKTDVFEGKMANKLRNEIPGVRGRIQSCISKIESLESELSWQISYLYNEIADLNNERWSWECQL